MTYPLTGMDHVSIAFDRACQVAPHEVIEHWYTLASHAVRMRVVGRALAAHYDGSFAHLKISSRQAGAARCSIDLWDEQVTGIPCPPEAMEEVPGPGRDGLATNLGYTQEARVARYDLPDASIWLDRTAQRLLGWCRHSQHMSLGEQARPLSPLLAIWHHDQGVYVLHAGLVARNGRGVLLGGSGGSGKSTTSLACLCHGFQFLGDDQIGLQEASDGSFIGYSLFNTTRVETGHLACFPLLYPHAITPDDPDDPKALVVLSSLLPGQVIPSVPIHAVVLPRVCAIPRSRLRPATKGEALLRLSRSTLLELHPSSGHAGLRQMARLTERVPTYWLELGRDLDTIAEQMEAVCTL